jgi:hypothetical protein
MDDDKGVIAAGIDRSIIGLRASRKIGHRAVKRFWRNGGRDAKRL